MSISSFVGRVLPAATAFVASGGNPLAAATSFAAADKARDDAKKAKLQNEKLRSEYQRSLEMTIGLDAFGGQGRQINTMPVSTQSSGGGIFFIKNGGGKEKGGVLKNIFFSRLTQLIWVYV